MEQYRDEINLIDYVKIIKKQRVTILNIIMIGIILAIALPFFTPKVYQATGYYKVTGFFFKPRPRQLVAEAKIKHPSADITIPKDTTIITIKTSGATSQETKNECRKIANTLPVAKIVDVSSKLLKPKVNSMVVIIIFTFFAFFIGFIKEWWEKNKEGL